MIIAGGNIVYEVLLQNSIPIIFSIANNQDLICGKLYNRRIECLEKYSDIDYSRLLKIIKIYRKNKIDLNDEIFNLLRSEDTLLVAKVLLEIYYSINRGI